MKLLTTILLILFALNSQGQTANAGADKTIYLTQSSSATLDGSASAGTAFQWREISTDYMSGATITNSTLKTATVSGVAQGTFYFEIAATTGGTTTRDTMMLRVNHDIAPTGSTLVKNFDMSSSDIYTPINDRSDTINFYPTGGPKASAGTDPDRFYLFRARLNGMTIDQQKGKFYATNQDGYAGEKPCDTCGVYPRTELQICDACFSFDTTHTYMFEWKGYLPQPTNYLADPSVPSWGKILTIFQVHGRIYDYAISNFDMRPDGIYYNNEVTGSTSETSDTYEKRDTFIGTVGDFYNKSHTLRVTMREGKAYPGQKAFIKMEMDGVTKYFRNTGGVGSAHFDDYVKFGSLYDWRSWITRKDSLARGRKYSLVTESFKVYQLSTPPPNIVINSNQVISIDSTDVGVAVSWAAGHSGTYLWTQTSGPSTASIPSYLSAATYVKKLITGTYVFRCTVTQDDGQTAYKEQSVTVNIPNPPPVVNAGVDQSITSNTSTLTGSATGTGSLTYSWSKVSGPSATITTPSSATTTVTGLSNGTYKFVLTVTDASSVSASDTMQLIVTIAPPTVNAGIDQSITTSSTTLTGSATGTITSYLWNKIAGGSVTITSPTSASTAISALTTGTYQFRLTATNNYGVAASDTVQVTVSIPVAAPTISTTNKTITTYSTNLSATATVQVGHTATYLWTKISGPSATISSSTTLTPNVIVTVSGVYVFRVTITQDDAQTAYSDLTLTANIPANPPTVTTSDKTVTTTSTTLTANVTSPAPHTTTMLWAQVSGKTAVITNSNSLTPTISGLSSGVYVFRITVTQDDGQVAYSNLTLTVALPNIPPTVNAGPDQFIQLPASTTSFSGAATPAAGTTISSVVWSKTSGGTYGMTGAGTLTPSLTGLNGVYVFRLTATQSDALTAYSELGVMALSIPISQFWKYPTIIIFKNIP
jgi:hypothetical protein